MKKPVRNVAIVVILLWTLFPFYSLVVTSVTPSGSVGSFLPRELTFQYYKEIVFGAKLGSPSIWQFMKNSIVMCGFATIGVLIISIPCAYGFSRWRTKLSGRLYLAYFILRMLPPIALLVPWYFIMSGLDLIDTYASLSFIYFIFQLPVGIWLMKGFFDTISPDLEEYAWIEGASVFYAFRKIVVPLVANGVSVTSVFVFIYCYIEYMYASIFTRTYTITLPPYIAGFSTPWEIRYQLMLASALISILPMMLLFFFAQRYMAKGLTGGALKY